MKWNPFLCPNCDGEIRGDAKKCPHCDEKLHPSAFTEGEQESEDYDKRGICELCERPYTVCDRDPCIEGMEPMNGNGIKPEYTVGEAMPGSIGLCADLYSEVRELRLAMQKIVDDVKARESEIRDHIINNLSKSSDTGAAGRRYRAQIVTKEVPSLADWETLTAFIKRTDRWDLLHKRVADKAVKEMWEAGEAVPGVEKFRQVDVSITKL